MRLFALAAVGIFVLGTSAVSRPVQAQGPPTGTKPPSGAPPKEQDTTAHPPAPAPLVNGKRTVTIVFPAEGEEHLIRFLPSPDAKDAFQLPIGPVKDLKTAVSYEPAKLGKSPRIAIDDVKSGNTAILPVPVGDTLELKRLHFDHIHTERVQVTYDNKPVLNALVTLEASDKTKQTVTIDPQSKGTVEFKDVPTGKSKLTIVYGDNLTETKDVQVSTDPPGGFLMVNAVVSTKVPTLDTPAPTAAGPGDATSKETGLQPRDSGPAPSDTRTNPPAPESGGGIVGMLGTLMGIALVAGAIFLLYKWFQSGGMAATLKKVGIETNGPGVPSAAGTPWQPNAPAAPVVSDPSLCQFCGQKKDASGNCACTLAGMALNTGPSSPAIPTQPRLVGTMGVYSGTVFPLNVNGSAVTLGREANNSIPLGNDTTVSRRHAAIRVDNGTYLVNDEGSSNGVFVNGVKINGAQPLRPGDEVQIGNTRFRFEV